MSNIEIIDRRGERKVEEAKPVVLADSQATDKSTWEEVKYAVAPLPARGGIVLSGRAMGLRSDGVAFVADWFFTADWDDCRGWEEKVKKRLDTFLNCECSLHAPCAVHRMYIEQWKQADVQRMELANQKPVPKVLEVLHKMAMAQREQAQTIALPRG